MAGKEAILILTCFAVAAPIATASGTRITRGALLRDGFVLAGVEGTLTAEDSNGFSGDCPDRWFFELASDVNGLQAQIKAGAKLEVMASARLEAMAADVNEHPTASYRVRGIVTKYRDRNFLFPRSFLRLEKASQMLQSENELQKEEPAVDEPNDVLAVPQEVKEKLKAGIIVREPVATERLRKEPLTKQDSVLLDKVGLIEDAKCDVPYVKLVFTFDALGRNVQPASAGLRLLPCEALQRAEEQHSAQFEPLRFKISGIATEYQGKRYLLLLKAVPVYSCGNFGI